MNIQKNLTIQWTNVLIIGNRSYKNLGDELILVWTIKLLQQQGKKIYIQAYDPKWLRGFLGGFVDTSNIVFLREIPKGLRSIFRFIRKQERKDFGVYRKIDSVIVGGGEILTEENPNSYRYRLISLLPLLIRKLIVKTNIYLMWWIQIPKKNQNIYLFKKLLSRTNHIYARDYETVDELKKFWYQNVDFFMDTAYFSWDWSKTKNRLSHKKYIIVNINNNGKKFLNDIIDDVLHYAKKWYHIYYVPVSKGKNTEYNDLRYYHILQERLDIDLLDWEYSFETFIEVIRWAEIVISTRLHLYLIASFLKTKTKVYPYQKKILKMQKVLKEMKY